jgi:hypothetical protein
MAPERHPGEPVDGEPRVTEIADGGTTWRFDDAFLTSHWTCIWGRGCLGILDEPAPELGQGCCSVGAVIDGTDEAMRISALADTLGAETFQFRSEASDGGIFADDTRGATRVVEGACIFLNRPGFAGGSGCALHIAAVEAGESPVDWKPSVCWQLPIKVDWSDDGAGGEVAQVRAWSRADWGPEGETMAWCCTEGSLAYVGEHRVVDSLKAELEAIAGTEVYIELRRRLTGQ